MRMVRNGVVVDFGYVNGIPATISFNGNTFYYVTNGQGDITGITDTQGNVLITYYYDAWGTTTSIYNPDTTHGLTLATINPLRYRGYVYDWEVGLYYLQSRYYIPEIGRFLNADGYTSTGQGIIDCNMYAYGLNNPITYYDPTGYSASWIKAIVWRIVFTAVTVVLRHKANSIHFSEEMDVCTDGKFCNEDLNSNPMPYGDTCHYGHTARLDGICADCVNYMVIPGDCPNKQDLLGCVGVIINNKTGDYVFAVVCEIGPNENGTGYGACAWDEVSIRAAWLLNGHQPGTPIANTRQYGSYTYIILPNTKQTWTNNNAMLQGQIDEAGKKYWPFGWLRRGVP